MQVALVVTHKVVIILVKMEYQFVVLVKVILGQNVYGISAKHLLRVVHMVMVQLVNLVKELHQVVQEVMTLRIPHLQVVVEMFVI